MHVQAKHPGTRIEFPGGAVLQVDHERPTCVPDGLEGRVEDAVRFTAEVRILTPEEEAVVVAAAAEERAANERAAVAAAAAEAKPDDGLLHGVEFHDLKEGS